MTVIAALVHGGQVWVASDSTGVDGSGRRWPNARKLTRVPVGRRGDYAVLGFCGHSGLSALTRGGQVELPVEPHDEDDDDADAWADGVARAVTGMVVDASPALVEDDGHMAGQGLLALRGRIWGVTEHSAYRFDRYAAIGSGGDLALGALEILAEQVESEWMTPADALRRAVAIACKWDSGCAGEIRVDNTMPPDAD